MGIKGYGVLVIKPGKSNRQMSPVLGVGMEGKTWWGHQPETFGESKLSKTFKKFESFVLLDEAGLSWCDALGNPENKACSVF